MSNYFSFFPTTPHDLTNVGQSVELTNILRRFKVKSSIIEDVRTFHDYEVQAGDRPDTVADKFYGDSSYYWLVLLFNKIHDPVFGWPLFNYDWDEFIKGKYGSIASAQATVHEYRKILTTKTVKFDGTIQDERYVVVDATTYATLGASVRQSISKYDWEDELNEKRRKIKILHERYLTVVRKQVKGIIKDGI